MTNHHVASDTLDEVAWSLAGAVAAAGAAAVDKDDPSKLHYDPAVVRRELEKLLAG